MEAEGELDSPYLGLWVTADNQVRQELLEGGRYVEARGDREGAYTGTFQIRGNHIEYQDDTGFEVSGDFVDGTLHHVGMELRRAW